MSADNIRGNTVFQKLFDCREPESKQNDQAWQKGSSLSALTNGRVNCVFAVPYNSDSLSIIEMMES